MTNKQLRGWQLLANAPGDDDDAAYERTRSRILAFSSATVAVRALSLKRIALSTVAGMALVGHNYGSKVRNAVASDVAARLNSASPSLHVRFIEVFGANGVPSADEPLQNMLANEDNINVINC